MIHSQYRTTTLFLIGAALIISTGGLLLAMSQLRELICSL